jgi:5'-3' exonuclease
VSLLLVDSASLYYRAFYALPTSIRSPEGQPVNAVRGFLDALTRLVEARAPSHVACCWDADWRPQWRVDAIPTYKSHRVADEASGAEEEPDELSPQIAVIRDCLDALGVPVVGVDGFEADDVIATLATAATGRVDVVSGDRDLLALVTEEIHLLYTGRPGVPWSEFGPAEVRAAYGVTAPQYADFALLRGDPSDGLPGVRGIGEKTAARLLSRYADLDALMAAAGDPDSDITPAVRRALVEGADYVVRARTAVGLVRDVPVPEGSLQPRAADLTRIAALGTRRNLTAPLGRAVAALDGRQAAP